MQLKLNFKNLKFKVIQPRKIRTSWGDLSRSSQIGDRWKLHRVHHSIVTIHSQIKFVNLCFEINKLKNRVLLWKQIAVRLSQFGTHKQTRRRQVALCCSASSASVNMTRTSSNSIRSSRFEISNFKVNESTVNRKIANDGESLGLAKLTKIRKTGFRLNAFNIC